jgi:hypothetical protein
MPAVYTDKIYDILQRENPDADLSTIDGIKAAAKHSLFTAEMLNFISEQHRDAFAAGFTLHYLQDEIGYPVFSAWRIALLEKIANNSEYINLIYDNLDKQVFANYRISKSEHEGTNIIKTTPNLTDETTHDTKDTLAKAGSEMQTDTTSGTHSRMSNAGKTQTSTDDSSNTSTKGATSNTADETKMTRDSADSANTTDNTGTANTDERGASTASKGEDYTDTTTPSGTRQTTNGGNIVSVEHGAQKTDGWNQYSDTPQGGLNAVREGTYLTNATYTEGNNEAYTDITHNGESTTTESFNNYKEEHKHTANSDSNVSEDTRTSSETRTDDTSSKTVGHNSSDGESTSTSDNNSDESARTDTTSNGTTTEEQLADSIENGRESGSAEHTLTFDERTDTSAHTGTDTVAHKGNTATDGADNATDNAESYEISMAMLLQSEPLMSRLWHLFDDLFMMIYDTYSYWN